MKKIGISIIASLALAFMLVMPACSPEYINPATASAEKLAADKEGLFSLLVGVQRRYSLGRQSPVYSTVTASGFSGQELRILNTGNTDENNLSIGKTAVDGSNSIVNQLWNQSFLTIKECNLVLDNLSKIADAGTRAGVRGYASAFKAMSLGNLATFFEKAPRNVGEKAAFVTRTELLTDAVALLDLSAKELDATTVSNEYTIKFPIGIVSGAGAEGTRIAESQRNLKSLVNMLLARYYNMLGNNDKALESANKVDAAARVFFNYDPSSPNPLFFVSFSNVNVYQPRTMDFGLPTALKPDADDKRVAFYLRNAQSDVTRPADPRGIAPFFFSATSAVQPQLPVFLPSEATLIKAEAFARKNQLTEAVAEINKIRKKTTDVWGLGAGQTTDFASTNQAAILTEIYRQRCIELFLSGLKLEDSRRFGRPDPNAANAERSRNFYPYPFSERDNNSNTPADPAI
jgi:hypothetical protein